MEETTDFSNLLPPPKVPSFKPATDLPKTLRSHTHTHFPEFQGERVEIAQGYLNQAANSIDVLTKTLEAISSQAAGGFFATNIDEFSWMLKQCGELADAAIRLARPETAPEGEAGT